MVELLCSAPLEIKKRQTSVAQVFRPMAFGQRLFSNRFYNPMANVCAEYDVYNPNIFFAYFSSRVYTSSRVYFNSWNTLETLHSWQQRDQHSKAKRHVPQRLLPYLPLPLRLLPGSTNVRFDRVLLSSQ